MDVAIKDGDFPHVNIYPRVTWLRVNLYGYAGFQQIHGKVAGN